MPVYVASGGTPPAMDPADVDDIVEIIFDWSAILTANSATISAREFVSDGGASLVFGDGVINVERAGQSGIIVPPERWLKLSGTQYVVGAQGDAIAVSVGVYFLAAGTYRIESRVVLSNDTAYHRSVSLTVGANL